MSHPDDPRPSSDLAFTPAVKAEQSRRGSRAMFQALEDQGGWESRITPFLRDFIATQNSLFLASASADGQPYVQHRGGPAGFVQVIDAHTLGFADFSGNRQYITLGNLSENPRVQLFLVDYARRRRVKVWGTATVVTREADPGLVERLRPPRFQGEPLQAIVIRVLAWDRNCSQHIPQRFEAGEVEAALAARDARIAELQAEIARLRALAGPDGTSA
ncbi:MAG: pyridoxamine 5'-phosphate oxidase family protein [Pseudomonadota bacterium]|nr:pyridoxamine 5'-phosphate oxidase family protein [Pseudomonadota bacterium]